MIRQGKDEGWLMLPMASLQSWMVLHGVSQGPVQARLSEGKGYGLYAVGSGVDTSLNPLLTVPRDLVLAKETVESIAKIDAHLKEVLTALGKLRDTTRIVVMVFLLLQATHNCPHISEKIGVSTALKDYIKFLPLEDLPIFWSAEDLEKLDGTSLKVATEAKNKSLEREFAEFRQLTSRVDWCMRVWWDKDDGILDFEDWKIVDAMYRSRALEFPGIGDCMVPCIDVANHASGGSTKALYESDANGNALLLLIDGLSLEAAEEVTITYGDAKGACEMIYSYGFLETEMSSAKELFLDLPLPDDDPLKRAKQFINASAPGVKLTSSEEGLHWVSDWVWLACVNEEDGAKFRVKRTTAGDTELEFTWKDEFVNDTSQLKTHLQTDELWPVFELRAISFLKDRLEDQLATLEGNMQEEISTPQSRCDKHAELIVKLRNLEYDFLVEFHQLFSKQQREMVATPVIEEYLRRQRGELEETDEQDDFS